MLVINLAIDASCNLLLFGTLAKWSDTSRLEHGPRSERSHGFGMSWLFLVINTKGDE